MSRPPQPAAGSAAIGSGGRAPRIAIVRLSAVGDCVQTMPVACALRAHLPTAHITWIVEKAAAPLVQAVDAVDEVLIVPKRFATSLRLLAQVRSAVRGGKFDIALDTQGLAKSALVGWLAGVPRRIGFDRPAGRELSPWLQTECVVSRETHMVERYLELLAPLGIARPAVRFGLQIPEGAEALAAALASRNELRGGYAVLNPGAGWDSKRWPLDRHAAVARHLATRGIPSVVAWGGPRERAWAEEIVTLAKGAAILAPPTTLLELAAVLRRAQLFVGSDTGPLHLAAAVGTRCIGLFGSSRAAACGPYGEGHIALQAALDTSPRRKRSGADNWAMRAILPEQVFAACDEALQAIPSPAAAA